MRVREYLTYRAKLKDVPRSKRRAAIDDVLERCKLVRRRIAGARASLQGYRQRVGLAEAMVHDPDILVLDEPTAGLDPMQIREVRALIRELGDRHTILLSTHIMSEVEAVCGRVIMIVKGKVAVDDRLDHLQDAIGDRARSPGAGPGDPQGDRGDSRASTRVGRDRSARARSIRVEIQTNGRCRPPRGAGPADHPERLGAPAARPPAVVARRAVRPGRPRRLDRAGTPSPRIRPRPRPPDHATHPHSPPPRAGELLPRADGVPDPPGVPGHRPGQLLGPGRGPRPQQRGLLRPARPAEHLHLGQPCSSGSACSSPSPP